MASPELVALADQRIASAAEFVDGMITALRDENAVDNPDSALEALALSQLLLDCYRRSQAPPETTCDALALVLRRLAAQ